MASERDSAPDRFWRMRPETMAIIVAAASAERRDAVWPRLLAPMCSMVRGASGLGEVETEWLERWLLFEAGRGDLGPHDVQTVQMPPWRSAMEACPLLTWWPCAPCAPSRRSGSSGSSIRV